MENIVNKNWKKNWSGGWSLISSYYLGFQYTKQLNDELGVGLPEALFVTKKGVTSCYFLSDDKEKFGKYFADQVEKDTSVADVWAKQIKDATDNALTVIKDLLTKEVSRENFDKYIKVMYAYGVPHRIIKVSVDYFSPERLQQTLSVLSEARVYAEPVYEYTEKYMQYVCEGISKETAVDKNLLLAMTSIQLEEYFADKKTPVVDELQNQDEIAVLYMKNGLPKYIWGAEAEKIDKSLNEESDETLKGQIAYKGKVTGTVRILSFPPKSDDFKEGDILVTGMTRPEYLSYFEKAAGVVTDAGGVLSHAAITARELKKPCIIGTEKATQVLKDGDMVEVDADNGVVRIIK